MPQFAEQRVADAMTYRPVTVRRDTTLAEADGVFARHGVDCVAVAEDGVLLGVFTKLDLLRAFAFPAPGPFRSVLRLPVGQHMTRAPVTVHPDTPLTRVLQLMADTRHRSLPVTIGALVIGMVTREDVVCALRRAAAGEPGGRGGPVPSRAAARSGGSDGRA
jgi:CBS domain-containing protein